MALSLESVTFKTPDGAAAVRLTVQVDVPGAFTTCGEQLNALSSCKAAVRFRVVDWLWPPNAAVTAAL